MAPPLRRRDSMVWIYPLIIGCAVCAYVLLAQPPSNLLHFEEPEWLSVDSSTVAAPASFPSYSDFEMPEDWETAADWGFVDRASPRKYYQELPESGHRMQAVREGPAGNETVQDRLRALMASFHRFAGDQGMAYWLTSGTLIGQVLWGRILPFDQDVDLLTTLGALHAVRALNRTLVEDRYWLDINPYYLVRASLNVAKTDGPEPNKIDARWVDTWTGHYIDVNALAAPWATDPEAAARAGEPDWRGLRVQDKSIHAFKHRDVFPLQPCTFEGIPSWCPRRKIAILEQLYPPPKFTGPHYQAWRLNRTADSWNKITCSQLVDMYTSPQREDCDAYCRSIVRRRRTLDWLKAKNNADGEKCCRLKVTWFDGERFQEQILWGLMDGEALPAVRPGYPPVCFEPGCDCKGPDCPGTAALSDLP